MPSHVVAGVAPVALRVEVAEAELVLQAVLDRADGARDLARDERLAAARRLVVEEDPVDGVHAVGLAVVDASMPVAVDLARTPYGLRGWNGVVLGLRGLGDLAVHLARRRLVEAALDARPARIASSSRSVPEPVDVGGVLGDVEADADVALRAEVVDLVRAGSSRSSWFSEERVGRGRRSGGPSSGRAGPNRWSIRGRVEASSSGAPCRDLVALLEQELGQVRAVLARDPGDERLPLRRPEAPFYQRTRGGAGSPWPSCHETTGLRSTPIRSISASITSPGLR